MRSRIATILVLSALCRPTLAEATPAGIFDWKPWRSLAVQDGGRQKPLDSLAWETWRMIGNRTSLTDPESGQVLDATAMYLTCCWIGRGGTSSESASACPARPRIHTRCRAAAGRARGCRSPPHTRPTSGIAVPRSWSIRSSCARALGMKEGEKYISPWTSAGRCCAILIPRRRTPFLVWTRRLAATAGSGPFPLREKGRRTGQPPARLSRPSCRTKTRRAADPQQ